MEYVYSAMVLHAAKKPVSEDGIPNVLKAAGVTPDAARVKALIAALEGVNIDEAIATAVAAPVAAAPAAAGPADKKDDKKKEEKKEEKGVTEAEAAAGLSALFG